MASNSTPLFIFDNPLHAVFLIGFGVVFGGIASLARFAAKHPDKIIRACRYSPWVVVFKGRAMTEEEAHHFLPPFFWRIYGGLALVFQGVGGLIVVLGLIGLITSLARKLI